MKNNRQNAIIEIIAENEVETQSDLIDLLRARGYDVTQATVSRDIKELKLLKSADENGKYRYVQIVTEEQRRSIKFGSILSELVMSAKCSGNLVVVKTHSGMAMAAATAIDSLEWKEILGTIAGDDTIFVAVDGHEYAENLTEHLNEICDRN